MTIPHISVLDDTTITQCTQESSLVMMASYKTVYLHSRSELLAETAALLNREWPRSEAARLAALEGSVDTLPCSLVLIKTDTASVVGHARLMAVAGAPTEALVESVVVCAELRGYGLGRHIMADCEAHCVRVGCHSLHLSTHNKQGFYHYLGYTDGPHVSGQRRCVSKLLSQCQTQSLLGEVDSTSSTHHTGPPPPLTHHTGPPPPHTHHTGPPPPLTHHTGPPPPPPPPPPKLVNKTEPSQIVTWMIKHLA